MAGHEHVLTLTDENFEAEVGASDVAMVDFGADWCPPCRIIEPYVGELAAQYAGSVKVGALDVDANQRTAARFGVRSIPTVLFFKGGKLVDTVVGAVPKPALESRLKQHLA